MKHVEDRYDRTQTLLERAQQVAVDETFVVDGRTYQRIVTRDAQN